jgi:hypothetical protein
MVNNVIGVVNYVIAARPALLNFMIADSLEGTGLSRSGGSAELINHLLASGSPQAAAILRPPSTPARRLTQENPHPAAGDLRYTGHQNAWQTPEVEAEP